MHVLTCSLNDKSVSSLTTIEYISSYIVLYLAQNSMSHNFKNLIFVCRAMSSSDVVQSTLSKDHNHYFEGATIAENVLPCHRDLLKAKLDMQ